MELRENVWCRPSTFRLLWDACSKYRRAGVPIFVSGQHFQWNLHINEAAGAETALMWTLDMTLRADENVWAPDLVWCCFLTFGLLLLLFTIVRRTGAAVKDGGGGIRMNRSADLIRLTTPLSSSYANLLTFGKKV